MKKCWDIITYPNRVNLPPYCIVEEYRDEWTETPYYQIVPYIDLGIEYEMPDYDSVINDKTYRGLCLEINDHGNVALWYKFKNGNCREIWSMV